MDREASDKELEKNLPTLKDNDFIKQKIRICIGDEAKQKLSDTLSADTNVCTFCFCFLFCFVFYILRIDTIS